MTSSRPRSSPYYQEWYDAGIVPRDFYYKLAELGLFGIEVPEEYGGAGLDVLQVPARSRPRRSPARRVSFGGSGVHVALCLPYILKLRHGRAEEALAARSSSPAR